MLLDVSLEEAQKMILASVPALDSEELPLMESFGRVLAADYYAGHDLPLQARSAVDGYALAMGQASVGSSFQLIETTPLDNSVISGNQAISVTTGGTLPQGTQAVVPHEKTRLQDGTLNVLEIIKPGVNIKTSGEDYKEGEVLAPGGTVIDAGAAAILAAFGCSMVKVRLRPRVAILALGNNIVPFHVTPEPDQIRDSNGPMLAALVTQDGGKVISVELADSIDTAKTILTRMLSASDLVICTGGTYAQGTDEAKDLLGSLDVNLFYWGVPVQPGSHHGAGRFGSTLILALSGNPAACAVGYQLFAAPALRAMQGLNPQQQIIQAICTNGFAKKSGSRRFVRGHAEFADGSWQVEVLPGQKPSMLKSLLNCNALIDLPAGTPPVGIDQEVTIWLL
ncbi:MAG: molybdopterin molybdotransferase MoeA [Deltaproteobacteria bacterium]